VAVAGVVLALAALGLQWLEYRLLAQTHTAELYVALIASAFLGLGVWLGVRLARRGEAGVEPAGKPGNPRAQASLGISDRELEVLLELAAGRTNKEIASRLNVSPNTVKTHITNLYGKLGAKRRTDAVLRARELGMLP
jgi:DNA-binding CsgD family transcriptional regulator